MPAAVYLGGNVIQRSSVEQDTKGYDDSVAVAGGSPSNQCHRTGAATIFQIGGVFPTHAAQL